LGIRSSRFSFVLFAVFKLDGSSLTYAIVSVTTRSCNRISEQAKKCGAAPVDPRIETAFRRVFEILRASVSASGREHRRTLEIGAGVRQRAASDCLTALQRSLPELTHQIVQQSSAASASRVCPLNAPPAHSPPVSAHQVY
jgi:hypothetical protein